MKAGRHIRVTPHGPLPPLRLELSLLGALRPNGESDNPMPQGDKSSYTGKQRRQAAHIEAGYQKKGFSVKTSEGRSWATVNKLTGGDKKSGSGRKKG